MKRRELFWMVLPCLGLVLFAYYMRNRPGADLIIENVPFQLVVESAKREPVDAYEVSQGYDSSLRVVIGYGGKAPTWWGTQSGGFGSPSGGRLSFEENGKLRPIKLPPDFKREPTVFYWRPSWNDAKKRYEARLLTHLSDIPARPGRIVVQANLGIQNSTTAISAPLHFSHAVRNEGEVIKAPIVSLDPGIDIEKIEVGPVPPISLKNGSSYGAAKNDTIIRVTLLRAARQNTGSASGGAAIQDETGKLWNINYSSIGDDTYSGIDTADPLQQRREYLSFAFNQKQIPLSAGRLWLKTKYSANHAWPLRISVPLRDAQGHALYTPLKSAQFAVESTQLRAADAPEKAAMNVNTILHVTVKYTGTLPPSGDAQKLRWRADWSQHLIDENGKEYWSFKGPSNSQINVSQQMAAPAGATLPQRRVTFLYYLPLQQTPARLGRLKFHADIGLSDSVRVPVDVVVRKSPNAPPPPTKVNSMPST